jgi:hypothetical protein
MTVPLDFKPSSSGAALTGRTRNSFVISRTVVVVAALLGLTWLIGAPASGCSLKCSEGSCALNQTGWNCGGYDAGVCPSDGGLCAVKGKCVCMPGRPGCDYDACLKAQDDQSESECTSAGTCVWSLVCAPSIDCTSWSEENECNSHPQCTFEAHHNCM